MHTSQQRQALQWMLARETAPPTVAVGATWLPTSKPEGVLLDDHVGFMADCRGGLLADEPVRGHAYCHGFAEDAFHRGLARR